MAHESNIPGSGRVNDPVGSSDRLAQPSGLSDDTLLRASGGGSADPGRRGTGRADQVRASAADGLEGTANAVHSGGASVARAAHSAADALASGARYIRENDTRDMIDDLMEVVRNNPGPALLGAVALGFLVGRMLPHR
jgi:hypothetical protein